MHFLHLSYYPTFPPFSLIIYQLSSSFPFPTIFLCLSRASIVQKRIIYFQDEGSLTIRLCEKGNDSCPSFPLFILVCPLWCHYPLFYLSFPPNSEQNSSQSFIPCLKEYEANRGSGGNCEDNELWISWESLWDLNIPLCSNTEQRHSFYVTCDFTEEKSARIGKLSPPPK